MIKDASLLLKLNSNLNICITFSIKYRYKSFGRSIDNKIKSNDYLYSTWLKFLEKAKSKNIKKVLLVSGFPKRDFNSVHLLRKMKLNNKLKKKNYPQIGIAWTPCYPTEKERKEERKRLIEKIESGFITDIWYDRFHFNFHSFFFLFFIFFRLQFSPQIDKLVY